MSTDARRPDASAARRLLAGALAAWAVAAPAAAHVMEVETFPAAPGQPRIVVARRPGALASVRIVFPTGAVDDGERRGLTRLAQHALVAANRQLDHAAFLLDAYVADADLTVETGVRECAFTLTADRREFPRLAKQLLTAVLSPRLDRARFARALSLAHIDGRQPGRGAGLASLVASLTMEDGRYLNEPFGERSSLEGLTFEDAAEHVERALSPAQATVIVTGRFDRDDLLRFVRGFKGGRASSPARPATILPLRVRKRAASEIYVLGYPLALASPRAAAAARLAMALVDAEIWKRLRDAGVGYSYAVESLRTSWLDALVVIVPAHDVAAPDLSDHLLATIDRVRKGGFDDALLERSRAAAIAALEAEDADAAALASALARDAGTWHGPRVAEQLRAMTRAELVAELPRTLPADRSLVAYFGPSP